MHLLLSQVARRWNYILIVRTPQMRSRRNLLRERTVVTLGCGHA
jgi:hypothetical protein